GTASPVGFPPHTRLEIDAHAEERLELLPGRGAGVFQDASAPPDHDALLRVALDADVGTQPQDAVRVVGVRVGVRDVLDLFHGHADGVRQLVAGDRKQLLAYELGGDEGL